MFFTKKPPGKKETGKVLNNFILSLLDQNTYTTVIRSLNQIKNEHECQGHYEHDFFALFFL